MAILTRPTSHSLWERACPRLAVERTGGIHRIAPVAPNETTHRTTSKTPLPHQAPRPQQRHLLRGNANLPKHRISVFAERRRAPRDRTGRHR